MFRLRSGLLGMMRLVSKRESDVYITIAEGIEKFKDENRCSSMMTKIKGGTT